MLLTTDAGHILINTGLPETVPQIAAGIEQLGFEVDDVKILLATHAHFDHVAGLAELERLTGAEVWMSEADAVLLEDGGKSDFRWGIRKGPRASRSPCARAAGTIVWSSPTWAASILA